MPDHVPQVEELGVSSAPLKSAAFFIGAHCQKYNGIEHYNLWETFFLTLFLMQDDFMRCKNESRDPEHCLKEGRRVTRCARDL